MKGKKLLALILTLTLCLGLSVPALAAEGTGTHEDFQDLMELNPVTQEYQWEWAWPTVDDTIRRGLFIGYTPYQDEAGNTVTNFGPGDPVTEAVGLTLCARMIVDAEQRATILNDRLEQMRELIPGTAEDPDDVNAPFMWFRKEAAACLELGVISAEDLIVLRDADRLGKAMTKADFAVYLVRAMGLEDFAQSLDAQDLSFFQDEAEIDRAYRPYIKLLYNYGVLTGDENQNFNPDQSMNRAVCATMLSRAIESILEDRNVAVELARYTDYPFTTGIIEDVSVDSSGERTLTLRNLEGTATYTLPSSVQIYQNNMPAKTTDLKNGSFAKLRLDNNGGVVLVRLTPAGFLSAIEGKCGEVGDETVVVDGVSYAIDRFTQVSAGGKVGDRSIIDPDAGYTTASLTVNSRKTVLTLTLTGGTRQVDGVLTDVTTTTQGTATKTTATVCSFNGLPTTYTVTGNVTITSGGSRIDGLKTSFEGKHVILRVTDSDLSDLQSIDVDINGQYVQGVLQLVTASSNQVQITRTGDTKKTPYEVDEDCVITYEGNTLALKNLPTGTFVTAKLEGAVITQLSAWNGLESVSGTLSVTYGDPVALSVTAEDGSKSEFSVALADLVDVPILVDGADGGITDLNTGDTVVITLRYRNIIQIDVTPRAADITGTLTNVGFSDAGTTLTVRLADGTSKVYSVSDSASIIREGNPVSKTDLVGAVGQSVALVTSGEWATTVQITGTASTVQDSISGTIISKDDQSRVATLLISDAVTGSTQLVNVSIPTGTQFLDVSGTTLTRITQLSVGDVIEVYGSYGTDGVFSAKSVIRK